MFMKDRVKIARGKWEVSQLELIIAAVLCPSDGGQLVERRMCCLGCKAVLSVVEWSF